MITAALSGDPVGGTEWLTSLADARLPAFADDSDVLQARAWIAVAEGDSRGACRLLEQGADTAARTGNLSNASALRHDGARLGQARNARPHLSALVERMDSELAQVRGAHVDAFSDRDASRLQRVGERFEALGTMLLAAEAFSEAAVELQRAGQARAASAAAQHAARAAAGCEEATTPALHGVTVRARLAPAELETARLAAPGQANRAIADLLHVSVRTVENRLQRVYEKLGVSGRQASAEALDEYVE